MILIGSFHLLKLPELTKLKNRIKKNEGYLSQIYLDQLGKQTIGYGHLIKKSEKFLLKKKYSKQFLNSIFENDFRLAINDFNKYYNSKKLHPNAHEVLIEMIFQLGIKKTMKFKKFNHFLKQKLLFLAALEMLNSLWYVQTPRRVEGLVKMLLGFK